MENSSTKIVSEFILKGKLRLNQSPGIDPAEIVVPFINTEVSSLWTESEHWQRGCSNILREISNKYPQNKRL